MDVAVNKKEYLKKYLASGGGKKKRKKAVPSLNFEKSKIIDDDLDLNMLRPIDDNDLEIYGVAEDAPQIAGFIDERPEEVRVMSQYRETKKWKIVTREYADVSVSEAKNSENDLSPPRLAGRIKEEYYRDKHIKTDQGSDSDVPVRRRHADSDSSPPRKSLKQSKMKQTYNSSEQAFPLSPSRKQIYKKSLSRDKNEDSSSRRRNHSSTDSDASPPRNKSSENSHRVAQNYRAKVEQRRNENAKNDRKDDEPLRQNHKDKGSKQKASQSSKTLEGKRAGLQNAKELRKEVAEIRHRQTQSLAELGDELSGRRASAVFRDKKTGRKRDLREEARQRRDQDEKQAEVAAKYAVWGKGMKQVDDRESKIKDDLHEMSKPLARYADDKDLDDMLRYEEKEGDPMLEYLRSKGQKDGKSKARPQYQGSFMPNRYNIKPGHRWDGVDRSSGYEKKFFEEMNSRKAVEEEAYKWSTEDM